MAHGRIDLVLAAVAADPAADHSVGALADRLGVSVRHVNRLFVAHIGRTPARYVEDVRLAAARTMLTATRARLPQIAIQTGFGSAETMRRAFLRSEGMPPGAYRSRAWSRSPTTKRPAATRRGR
jgi:transcriptional regulator GlxA family with amidase domain